MGHEHSVRARSYLAHCDVVSGLLETRCVVVAVPDNDADLVQYHRPHQLVGTLNLDDDGLDVRGGLENKRETGVGRELPSHWSRSRIQGNDISHQ